MPPSLPEPIRPASSPLATLLQAYDQAIAACRARSARTAYRCIATLRAAHPCDTATAVGIDALYAWCERAVLSGDYLGAARTLDQLRGAWQAADRLTALNEQLTSRHTDRHGDDERHPSPTIGA
jgi:hypothetical protein